MKNVSIKNNVLFHIFFILFFSISILFQCKEEPNPKKVLAVQNDTSLDFRSATGKIVEMIFDTQLKEWTLEQDPKTSLWTLVVTYGGSSALTFSSQLEYADQVQKTQALYHAQIAEAMAQLPIQELRLSLTKPLYVKGENHPDAAIQEFEIYRTSIPKAKINDLVKSTGIDPFGEFKTKKAEIFSLLDQIQKISQIELNELDKITVE